MHMVLPLNTAQSNSVFLDKLSLNTLRGQINTLIIFTTISTALLYCGLFYLINLPYWESSTLAAQQLSLTAILTVLFASIIPLNLSYRITASLETLNLKVREMLNELLPSAELATHGNELLQLSDNLTRLSAELRSSRRELNWQLEELKISAEEKSQLASVVENSIDAIISTDLLGNILTWNKAAEALFGYDCKEILGKHISLLVPENCHKQYDGVYKTIKSGPNLKNIETKYLHKSGDALELSLSLIHI